LLLATALSDSAQALFARMGIGNRVLGARFVVTLPRV
jgi:hypothetical protein